jgi:hypothetical protein
VEMDPTTHFFSLSRTPRSRFGELLKVPHTKNKEGHDQRRGETLGCGDRTIDRTNTCWTGIDIGGHIFLERTLHVNGRAPDLHRLHRRTRCKLSPK